MNESVGWPASKVLAQNSLPRKSVFQQLTILNHELTVYEYVDDSIRCLVGFFESGIKMWGQSKVPEWKHTVLLGDQLLEAFIGKDQMTGLKNSLGQAIGFPTPDWQTRQRPPRSSIEGQYCRVEAYNPDQHNQALYEAFAKDRYQGNWTYLPYGPFDHFDDFDSWARSACQGSDPMFHSIIDLETENAGGLASFLRITPDQGVIEVGHIHFSPLLQRTKVATEAMFLMMSRVFDELGYRRYEWKCDALNEPSCRSAKRLGFTYEGTFRQAVMYKNRNRDTAWYAIIDKDWPAIRSGYQRWLNAENFHPDGQQKHTLNHFLPFDLISDSTTLEQPWPR